MSSLGQTSHTPHMLRAILLVGGGARIPLVRNSIKEGVGYLSGDAYANGSGGGETLDYSGGRDGRGFGCIGSGCLGE